MDLYNIKKNSKGRCKEAYNDSINTGTPSATKNGCYIWGVALFAMIDSFEHAICKQKVTFAEVIVVS